MVVLSVSLKLCSFTYIFVFVLPHDFIWLNWLVTLWKEIIAHCISFTSMERHNKCLFQFKNIGHSADSMPPRSLKHGCKHTPMLSHFSLLIIAGCISCQAFNAAAPQAAWLLFSWEKRGPFPPSLIASPGCLFSCCFFLLLAAETVFPFSVFLYLNNIFWLNISECDTFKRFYFGNLWPEDIFSPLWLTWHCSR